MNIQALVQEFHETFGHPVALTPGLISKERAAFRVSLIEEELQELKDAIEAGDLVYWCSVWSEDLYAWADVGLTEDEVEWND